MTSKELTIVAIQVFAIYLFVQAIMMLPLFASGVDLSGVSAEAFGSTTIFWALGLASIIVLLILAGLIWRFSTRIVAKAEASAPEKDSYRVTETFLLSLLGVYFVVEGLQAFGLTMSGFLLLAQNDRDINFQSYGHVAAGFFELLVGVSLVLKASGWANLLRRLRGAGLPG